MADDIKESSEAARLAYRATALGREDAVALASGGYALSYFVGKPHESIAFIQRALAINPNFAPAWYFSGWTRLQLGEAELAMDRFRHAMRLSPLDPLLFLSQGGLATAYFLLGRYNEAASWAGSALGENPKHQPALRLLAASHALAGRLEDAQNAVVQLREIDPRPRVSDLAGLFSYWPGALDKYVEGLRKAGLPE